MAFLCHYLAKFDGRFFGRGGNAVYSLLVLGIIASILTMFVYIGIGKFILRLDVSKLQELPPDFYEKAKNIKLTKEGKIRLNLLAVFILCMCLPSFAPKLPFSPFLKEMGLQGCLHHDVSGIINFA